ncbi:MAG: gliding motility lipoprotein GldJ [Bacteroidetes bacterium]|nr:MAG: gliding motility lipoprotein GldJ [Bacteroidota bacterium]
MKIKSNLLTIALFGVLLFLSSCFGGKGGGVGVGDVSNKTGWDYNDPDMGRFEVVDYAEQETGPGLVFIEGGTFIMGRTEPDVIYDWNNIPRRYTVASFYMDETEVSNVDYREYINWLQRVFVSYPNVALQALPDTMVWRKRLAYNEPYVEYYFRHPAYHNYPVVGVSWLQATDYAAWRTDRVNEKALIDEGILEMNPNQVDEDNFNTEAYLAGQYESGIRENLPTLDGGERHANMEDGIMLPKYRLPTEAEWEYAALALIGNSTGSPERIYNRRLFPWNGDYVRNDTKQNQGQFRGNFQRGRGDMMGVAGALNDNASIPAPVDAYWPNDYGLYCMAGNVNEWCLDVYRAMSSQDLEGFRPYRGNVFKTVIRNDDGSITDKDSLGRIQWREMTDEESVSRVNYHTANNINYGDGDSESSISESNDWLAASNEQGSDRMYFSGSGPKGKGMTSLISDRSRVYKGGGWNDRVYWLSPGTRRFLDERKSSGNIGFRCAMTRVGSSGGF